MTYTEIENARTKFRIGDHVHHVRRDLVSAPGIVVGIERCHQSHDGIIYVVHWDGSFLPTRGYWGNDLHWRFTPPLRSFSYEEAHEDRRHGTQEPRPGILTPESLSISICALIDKSYQ